MVENIANPRHIAIIMDGNGRWAQKRFLTKKAGHKAGADTLEKICRYADKIGIEHVTVYAFSTENWKRSAEEIEGLMDLLRHYLNNHIHNAKTDHIKIDIIGDKSKLDIDIQEKIKKLEAVTKDKKGMCLHIAINYGGRDEILRSVKRILAEAEKDTAVMAQYLNTLDEPLFESFLDTQGIPDPELVIRTSGEMRISNFLLWQCAYSELYFHEGLWPDFTTKDFDKALESFQNRSRRFGGR